MRCTAIAATVIAVMMSGPVLADAWRPLTVQSDGTRVGILPASIRHDGDLVSSVLRFTPRGKPEWASLVSLNCQRRTVFSARLPAPSEGKAVIQPAAGAYRPIRDGSVGATMAAVLCPSHLPADISIGGVGGGPLTSLPVDRPR